MSSFTQSKKKNAKGFKKDHHQLPILLACLLFGIAFDLGGGLSSGLRYKEMRKCFKQ